MDGIETAKIINTNYNIPIIFITAYGDKKTLDRAKLSEPYGYIVKPITSEDDLFPTIELAMYNHQVRNKLRDGSEKFEQIKQLIQPDNKISTAVVETSLKKNADVEPTFEIDVIGEKVNLVDWLKAFSNPDRFLILELLKSQPLKLDEIQKAIDKSQSTASHHIRKLEKTGFITGWKKGKYISYSLNKQKMMEFVVLWESWIKSFSSKNPRIEFITNASEILRECMEIIGNEERFLILNLINKKQCLLSDIEEILNKNQPSISHHIRLLESHEFIHSSKKGKFKKYSIYTDKFTELLNIWNQWFQEIRLKQY
jgi:DNA-binding transcriptional ArsR family regulator